MYSNKGENKGSFTLSALQVVDLQNGGGKGIRTPDLLIANETLYQLSYTPTN